MGVLDLDCIATHADTGSLYGIATAEELDDNNIHKVFIVLVKSGPSPSNLISTTWSVVSTLQSSDSSYVYPKFRSVDCAVSSKGEFTALFRNDNRLVTTYSPTIPIGIQYNSLSSSWSKINGSPMYGWKSNQWHQSAYVKRKDDKGSETESFVHLSVDQLGNVVRFGTVDVAHNMLQLAGIWKLDESSQEYNLGKFSDDDESSAGSGDLPMGMRYTDQRQFALGYNQLFEQVDGSDTIRSFSLSSAVEVSRKSTSYSSEPNSFFAHYFFSGLRGNTTFVCGLGFQGQLAAMYTITEDQSGMKTLNSVPSFSGTNIIGAFDTHSNIAVAGGRQQGQEPFGVALSSKGLFEIQLFGPEAGNMTGPFQIDVPQSLYSQRPRNGDTNENKEPNVATNDLNHATTVDDSPYLEQLPRYTYRDELQGIGLSNHPQPNVVTSVRDT
ncbi:hypothetical protein FBU30_003493 [Linnemannia zychae]|nr:hypothetical protein FBU30_003493 [Linnemannia zychae]